MEVPHPTPNCTVVLLSGGLDSATVAAECLHRGRQVLALTVDYGQRHRAEIAAALQVAQELGVQEHLVIPLDLSLFGGSALTDLQTQVPKARSAQDSVEPSIPVTYVPARNTVFLSLALALAEARGADEIAIGVNALDYSGYPDCRPEFIAAFQDMATLGTKAGVEGRPVRIVAPLQEMSKVEILRLAREWGVPIHATLSCYDPGPHAEPCGLCDSCRLRLQAEEALS